MEAVGKKVETQVQFWTLLGPFFVLLSIAVLLFKVSPHWYFPVSALIGIPLCVKWRMKGMAISLGTLFLLAGLSFQYLELDDRYWHVGLSLAMAFSFIVLTLSLEEAQGLVSKLQLESQSRLDNFLLLDDKWKAAELNWFQEKEKSKIEVEALTQEIGLVQEGKQTFYKLAQLSKEELIQVREQHDHLLQDLTYKKVHISQLQERLEETEMTVQEFVNSDSEKKIQSLTLNLNSLERETETLKARVALVQNEIKVAQAEKEALIADKEGLIAEKEDFINEKQHLINEKESLITEREIFILERENLLEEKKRLIEEINGSKQELDANKQELNISKERERLSLIDQQQRSLLAQKELEEKELLFTREIHHLTEQIQFKTEQMIQSQVELESNQIKLKAIQAELKIKSEEHESALQRVHELSLETKELSEERSHLFYAAEQQKKLERDVILFQRQLSDLQEELVQAQMQIQVQQQQLQREEQTKQQLQEQLHAQKLKEEEKAKEAVSNKEEKSINREHSSIEAKVAASSSQTRSVDLLYNQLKEQFKQKCTVLDETRRELFYANEALLAFKKDVEEEHLYDLSVHERNLQNHILSLSHEFEKTRLRDQQEIDELTQLVACLLKSHDLG